MLQFCFKRYILRIPSVFCYRGNFLPAYPLNHFGSRGRCKAASQAPGGSGHTRSSRARILSNSPNEHQGEGRATTCSGGGESSSGGDENLQGSGNEATGSLGEMRECG